MLSHRRVHRLTLRAGSPEEIQHGAIVVEDALRTASLPGLPQNGLLLIRRLDLGKLAAEPTSTSVAQRIASRLLTLKVSIIRHDAAEQPRAEVIWFPDEVEPYAILSTLLVRNIQPQSWYWPRAVRGWSARMPPELGLRHVLYEVSRTPAGIAGATRIVEHIISAAGAAMLGRTLQPDDGHRLLALGGVQSPKIKSAKGTGDRAAYQVRHLDRSWQQIFSRLVPHWGPRDDRITWLAHVAVCASRGIPSTPAASGLLQDLQRQPTGLAAHHEQPPVLPIGSESGIKETDQQHAHNAGEGEQAPVQDEFSESTTQAKAAGKDENTGRRLPRTIEDVEAADAANGSDSGHSGRTNKTITDHRPGPSSPEALISPDATVVGNRDRSEPFQTAKDDSMPSSERSTTRQDEHQTRRHRDVLDTSGGFEFAGTESKHAGLVFVVQALEWLGIRETLTAHPALEMDQLPARVLWYCVNQLGIAHDDPICHFLPALNSVPTAGAHEFVAPAPWLDLFGPSKSEENILVMRRVQNSPGKRVLYADHSRLTIALWRRQIPAAARRLAQGCILQRQSTAPAVDDLDQIIRAYISAMGRLLHKYAQTDLRQLVNRPGYVATTRTHFDVTFDQTQVDLGIRRAGLDIDPGWIPWLGRVVCIHYSGMEEIIDV